MTERDDALAGGRGDDGKRAPASGGDGHPPGRDPSAPEAPAPADGVSRTREAELARRLEALRDELLALDEELIRLVGNRRDRVLEVGRIKAELGRPVLDPAREAKVIRRAAARARELEVDEELVRDVLWRIVASAREAQTGDTHWGPPSPPATDDPPG